MLREDLWVPGSPSYERRWDNIERLLEQALQEMAAQRAKFHLRKWNGPKEAKYRALMKYDRAKGIERRWAALRQWLTGLCPPRSLACAQRSGNDVLEASLLQRVANGASDATTGGHERLVDVRVG